MHRHSFSFDLINFPLSLLGLFLLFLSMRIVVVVVLYFAMWSLSLFHMFVFCSCRMSTLTHSFRVCYLQFALTRDNHPKERKSSKCCRFSLVPAGQYCWFECPTSSSSSKELVHLCVYFIQSGTWQSSRVAFKSRILWILREIYKIEIALRCALSLERGEKSIVEWEKSCTERAGGGKNVSQRNSPPEKGRQRPSIQTRLSSACDQLTRILKIMMFAVWTDRFLVAGCWVQKMNDTRWNSIM